jgi:hypothetical protein
MKRLVQTNSDFCLLIDKHVLQRSGDILLSRPNSAGL